MHGISIVDAEHQVKNVLEGCVKSDFDLDIKMAAALEVSPSVQKNLDKLGFTMPEMIAFSARKLKKKMADNAAIPLYQKYYKRYAARVRVRQIKEPDFKKWKYQAMTKRDECTDGKITLAEFEEWLESSFPNRIKKNK